jgi:hypothetical protein
MHVTHSSERDPQTLQLAMYESLTHPKPKTRLRACMGESPLALCRTLSQAKTVGKETKYTRNEETTLDT